MRLLDRYLAWRVAGYGSATAAVLVLLFSLITFGDELNKLGKGYDMLAALWVSLAQAPRWLFELFPSAMLVGLVALASVLVGRSEWAAMQAAGYGLGRLLVVVGGMTLFLALLVLALYEAVAPSSQALIAELKGRQAGGALVVQGAVWSRDPGGVRLLREVGEGRIALVEVYRVEGGRLQSWVRMEGLQRLEDGRWRADRWWRWSFADLGVVREVQSDRVVELQVDERLARLARAEVAGMGVRALYRAIVSLRAHGLDSSRYEVRLYGRVLFPWYVVNLALLGWLVTVRRASARGGGVRHITVGVLVGVAAYLVNNAWDYVVVLYELGVWEGKLAFQLALSLLNLRLLWSMGRLRPPAPQPRGS